MPRPRLVSIPCREAGMASWEAPQPRGGGGGDEVRGEHGEESVKHGLLVAAAGGMGAEVVLVLELSPEFKSLFSVLAEVFMGGSEESLLPAATGNITLHCFFRGAACNQSFRIKSGNKLV